MENTEVKNETKKHESEVFVKIKAKKVAKFKAGAELGKAPTTKTKRWVDIELEEKHEENSQEYSVDVHLRANCEEDISDE